MLDLSAVKVSEKPLSRASSTPVWSLAGVDKNPKPLRPIPTGGRWAPPPPLAKRQSSIAKDLRADSSVGNGAAQMSPPVEDNGRSIPPQAEVDESAPKSLPPEEAKGSGAVDRIELDDRQYYQARCFSLSSLPRFMRGSHQRNGEWVFQSDCLQRCTLAQLEDAPELLDMERALGTARGPPRTTKGGPFGRVWGYTGYLAMTFQEVKSMSIAGCVM